MNDPNQGRIPLNELLPTIADAAAGFRHAQIVSQQRLSNFLLSASILLLGAAAVVSTDPTVQRQLFLGLLAVVGMALSIAWVILGLRQRTFIELHLAIICSLESQIADEKKLLRVSEPIALLHKQSEVVQSGIRFRLLPWENRVKSDLLVCAPAALALVFAALICFAVCGWK